MYEGGRGGGGMGGMDGKFNLVLFRNLMLTLKNFLIICFWFLGKSEMQSSFFESQKYESQSGTLGMKKYFISYLYLIGKIFYILIFVKVVVLLVVVEATW